MANFYLIIILFCVVACTSCQEKPSNECFTANEKVHWIQDERELPSSDSLFYLDYPAPLFRKEFNVGEDVESAKLLITAAGYYKASINGKQVGENVLDPAWTDFSKRIYYSEYDVSLLLKKDDNCLGVSLGNGFYNPLPLRKWGSWNLRNDLTVGKPAILAKLVINYKNGKTEEIGSDTTWKYALGPIIRNDVYIGVLYDARKEIEGWNIPGFNDSLWKHAKKGKSPGGELHKTFFPPVQITEEITPVGISSPAHGIYVVDMGINFTGSYKMKLEGNPGDTILLRFGERVYDDGNLNPMTTVIGQIKSKGVGGPGAPDIAWQTDSYIVGNAGESWFSPEFRYHTYRFMEIGGVSKKPRISDVKGLFIHSNVEKNGSFSCSSELLNSIQDATQRTFRANLVSVQSDCAAREKFGYGGDLNATSESFIYNYNMQEFYRKTIYDWIDAMNDSCFVDTAPYTGIKYCGISWESAYLTTQYYLYLYYNDTDIVRELYEFNKKWMEKVSRLHSNGLVESGLSDHESLEPVPVQLTGTCHYLQCAQIMETFAAIMGDTENELNYGNLVERLRNLVKAEFWDKPVKGIINRQTLFATLLYHGIVPEDEISAAKDSLLKAVENGPSGHFNTGIFGTKYVLETLSENTSVKEVFDIVNSTVYPGWGYMVDNGATTIWETWKESDDTFSNCHPMFGTVTEWYYRWLGGIRPIPEKPGFKEFILAPSIPKGLEYVNCTYRSPHGNIVSNWKIEKNGTIHYEFEIPKGSKANVFLDLDHSQKICLEKGSKVVDSDVIKCLETGAFIMNEGAYNLTILSDNKN